MGGRKSCMRCRHRRDYLYPCEWLYMQKSLIADCPYFEEDFPRAFDPDGNAVGVRTIEISTERLFRIAGSLYDWILRNAQNPQSVYDKCGLTDEENDVFGHIAPGIMGRLGREEEEKRSAQTAEIYRNVLNQDTAQTAEQRWTDVTAIAKNTCK